MKATRVFIVALAGALTLAAAVTPALAGDETGDRFMTNTRQLTYEGRRAGESYFSPDGRYLLFQSERIEENPFYQIYMMDLETGDIHRVSPGTGKTTCSYFRPGTDRVLYASTHLDPEAEAKQKEELEFRASGKARRYAWDYDETFDIFSANRDGSETRRLTEARGYDAEGGYSPDGSQIVFCSMRDAYNRELSAEDAEQLKMDPSYFGEIYIMDADGSNPKRLTDWPGYDGGPFFTPNGERIVWRHFEPNGAVADVYTMKLDGSDRRRLTHFKSMCWAPYFHPTSKYVIFTTNKQGFSNFELYLVDPEGKKEPVRVTFTDGFDGLPVFSPDGKRLVWTSTRTSTRMSQVFLADWDHDAALEAVKNAPPRELGDDEAMRPAFGREAVAGYEKGEFEAAVTAADMGRMAGGLAGKDAGKYIASCFESLGLTPLGDDGSYLQKNGNVVGYLPPAGDAENAPVLVIGAHVGEDASGPATMMELAGAMAARHATEPDRFSNGVVFAAWSGAGDEDTGAAAFAESAALAFDRVAAYVHIGDVGSLRENQLLVQGTASSGSWRGMVERRNIPAGFNLTLDDDHAMPDDVDAFYSRKIPVIALSTSARGYHASADTDGAPNVDGMVRVGKFALMLAMDVAGADERMAWVEVKRESGGRSAAHGSGPYLGTVPDYRGGDDVAGVLLTGVTPGSPAEKAGLAAGDVIVEFGGKPIKDIYEYSYALDAVSIGKPVKVVVMRGGERMEFTVTPEARN